MSIPAPAWHTLLSGNTELDTTAARQDLSGNIRYIEQNGGRILLTTYAKPRAALVSLQDIALLRILDLHPELKEQVKTHLPS
jgi:hypothetical protein